ncbi:hypothetical protein Tco_0010095 [Tanacetum coccineum]
MTAAQPLCLAMQTYPPTRADSHMPINELYIMPSYSAYLQVRSCCAVESLECEQTGTSDESISRIVAIRIRVAGFGNSGGGSETRVWEMVSAAGTKVNAAGMKVTTAKRLQLLRHVFHELY